MTTEISKDEKIYGKIDERIKSVEGKLDTLIKLEKRKYMNYFEVVKAKATTKITKLNIEPIGNNLPILRIEVLTIGGGLILYINNQDINQGINCSVGTVIENTEIYELSYEVLAGTATIIIQARID